MATIIESIKTRYALDDDAHVGVRWFNAEKQFDDSQRLVTAIATTDAVDLVDEVVLPEGAMVDKDGKPFYANTILLNHDPNRPVGKIRTARLDKSVNGWVVQFTLASTELGRDTYTLLKEGVIGGTSIGFRAQDWGRPSQKEVDRYGPIASIIRKWLWLELSVTPTPCNPEAMVTDVKSLTISEEVARELNRMAASGYIAHKTLDSLGVQKTDVRKRTILVV